MEINQNLCRNSQASDQQSSAFFINKMVAVQVFTNKQHALPLLPS